jgi:hypothetical protein
MSKDDLIQRLHLLYEVVEVNNVGAVPLSVASETLRLVNPGITVDQAEVIAMDADSRGKQLLQRDDFTRAALTCLQNTDVSDAIGLIKDLTVRMRVAFRRRFLMYDAPANSAPPSLLENAKMVAMFRELFDMISRGTEKISRHDMKRLMNCVLPEYSVDAGNACKAALGDGETDHIGFYEFLMVVQPTTVRRCLSDMIVLARREAAEFESEFAPAPSRGRSTHGPSEARADATKGPHVGGHNATERLRQELQSYRMQEHFADQRVADAMASKTLLAPVPQIPLPPPTAQVAANEELVTENTKLRLRNEELERMHRTLSAENASLVKLLNGTRGGDRSVVDAYGQPTGTATDERTQRIAELEDELRQARARLAISGETRELVALLRRGDNPHSVVRNFYPDESVFVGKHQYLREACKTFDDGVSPISTILGQYDLIIVGYQALYRQLRSKYESERAKSTFDSMEAARSIVPRGQVVTPTRRGASPAQTRASPMKWKELDREPTVDMRGTRTLADPLLTDEERHLLRAKLAAQMRGTARHYTPSKSRSNTSQASGDVMASILTSQDALHRLQNMTGRAHRHRYLE